MANVIAALDLVATSCACCGRPLVDATSVEAGVGPECRKKHGFAEAQAEPDWDACAALVAGLGAHADRFAAALDARDARRVANVATWLVATRATGEAVRVLVVLVSVAGYRRLADRIAQEEGEAFAVLPRQDGTLEVRFGFDPEKVEAIRSVPGRRFDPDGKVWTVPVQSRVALWAAMRRVAPGQLVRTQAGIRVIPAQS